MNSIKKIVVTVLLSGCFTVLSAQNRDVEGNMLFHFGVNVVDDAGNNLKPFYYSKARNFTNPFVMGVECRYHENWSLKGTISLNKYIAGKIIDKNIIYSEKEATYTSVDISNKYILNKFFSGDNFKPYVLLGVGYTIIGKYAATTVGFVPSVGRINANAGFGANYWISDTLGFNVQIMGKFGLKLGENKQYINNHSQFSMGVFAPFKIAKNAWR